MPDDRYLVLLNDALKGHVLSMGGRARARLREKFEFLENGFWDAGVRVKKLRGTAGRVVFEARLNRGDRLLFTLGPHRGRTAIYVWGLVSHDDISAAAARIVPGQRAVPRLRAAGGGGAGRPRHRQPSPRVAKPGGRGGEGPRGLRPAAVAGPRRRGVAPASRLARPLGLECHLLLTREQEALLSAPLPVLLSGTAGSGKTTLSVYYLLRGTLAGSRRLFLTYNPLLRDSCGAHRGRAWR